MLLFFLKINGRLLVWFSHASPPVFNASSATWRWIFWRCEPCPASVVVRETTGSGRDRGPDNPIGRFYHLGHFHGPLPISEIITAHRVHANVHYNFTNLSIKNNTLINTSSVQLCNLGAGTVNASAWFHTGWQVPLRHSVFFFFSRLPLAIRYNFTSGSNKQKRRSPHHSVI